MRSSFDRFRAMARPSRRPPERDHIGGLGSATEASPLLKQTAAQLDEVRAVIDAFHAAREMTEARLGDLSCIFGRRVCGPCPQRRAHPVDGFLDTRRRSTASMPV